MEEQIKIIKNTAKIQLIGNLLNGCSYPIDETKINQVIELATEIVDKVYATV